jgi:hypothetical protein
LQIRQASLKIRTNYGSDCYTISRGVIPLDPTKKPAKPVKGIAGFDLFNPKGSVF